MGQKVLSVLLVISIIINIGLFLQWQEAVETIKNYKYQINHQIEINEKIKADVEENYQNLVYFYNIYMP